jgi:glycosyltransferase involved in cell wall biosynthesis
VGRLTHQKGHDLLVPVIPHILEKHPGTWFVWAGEGPNQRLLEQQAEEHGVRDHVFFLGRRADIPDLLNAADLFVHPTRFEGQPFSMLEAMAAGLPIVTTRASAICEVIDDRVHGLLGRVEDIRDLRENLLFALGNPTEMAAMAARALERLDDHTEQGMIDQTLALLGEISR